MSNAGLLFKEQSYSKTCNSFEFTIFVIAWYYNRRRLRFRLIPTSLTNRINTCTNSHLYDGETHKHLLRLVIPKECPSVHSSTFLSGHRHRSKVNHVIVSKLSWSLVRVITIFVTHPKSEWLFPKSRDCLAALLVSCPSDHYFCYPTLRVSDCFSNVNSL